MKRPRLHPHAIFPIVSDLDPMVRPEATAFTDWSELESALRPVVHEPSGLSHPPGRVGFPDGVFSVGTGAKLLHQDHREFGHLDFILDCAQEIVFGFEDKDGWRRQRSALRSLIQQFLGPFARRPCLIYAHQVYWCRPSGHRVLFPGGITTAQERRFGQDAPNGTPITLGFSWEDEAGIVLDADRLLWVDPMRVEPDEMGAVMLLESPDLHLGPRVAKPFHRQRVARSRRLEHVPELLEDGVFAVTAERLRPVLRHTANGRPIAGGYGGAVVDEAGLLDAPLLRVHRINEPQPNGEVVMDELAVTFRRSDARILEVSTERERSGPEYAESFERGALGRWLTAHL